MFSREEFAEAGTAFRTRRWATAEELLTGYRRLVARNVRRRWVVFDWTCAAMAEDLPWAADQRDLDAHLRDVTAVTRDIEPVVLFLDAPIETAFARARTQRGRRWLEHYAELAEARRSSFSPESTVEDRALSFFRQNLPANPRNATAFQAARWPRVSLDAAGTSERVFAQAIRALALDARDGS